MAVENDGMVASTFTVKGIGAATGYTVAYIDLLNNMTDVTTAVKAGTFTTGVLSPGGAIVLGIRVTVSATAANTANFYVGAFLPGGISPDVVRASVNAT
jgi:hypothetical protein